MVKPQYYHYQNQAASGEAGSWSNYLVDAYAGTAVGLSHFKWFVGKSINQGLEDLVSSLYGTANRGQVTENNNDWRTGDYANSAVDHNNSNNNYGEMTTTEELGGLKVVGVGYGRTGTYSLAIALEMLGFPTLVSFENSPLAWLDCKRWSDAKVMMLLRSRSRMPFLFRFQHTAHLYRHSEIFDHMINNIFHKSIQSNEIIMGRPDFDLLLKAGYTATMDLPFALYFTQIRERYPECKFILTVREDSDTWFRSWDVMANSITQPAQHTSYMFAHVKKVEYYMR